MGRADRKAAHDGAGVSSFPAVIVLDAKGVIGRTDVTHDRLEKAVRGLMQSGAAEGRYEQNS